MSKPLDFPSFPLPVFDHRSSGAALGDEEQLEYVASCYHEPCCQQVQESRRLGDEEQYIASCYHRLCCQQAQESWRQDIRGQWRGKLIKIKLELNKCYMPVRELRSTSFSVIPVTSSSLPSCFRPSRHFSVTVVSLFYLPFLIVFYRLSVFRPSSILSLRIYSAPCMFRASFLGFVATLS